MISKGKDMLSRGFATEVKVLVAIPMAIGRGSHIALPLTQNRWSLFRPVTKLV